MAETKLPLSNSFATKAGPAMQRVEPPKQNKVIQNEVRLKEPSRFEKLKSDAKSSAKNVMANTIAPSIKDMILNAIWTGLSMIFFPDGSRRSTYSMPSSRIAYGAGYHAYGSYYDRPSAVPAPSAVNVSSEPLFRNPIFKTLNDAKEIVSVLQDIINEYGYATISNLYDLCGMGNMNWQGTTKYGWVSTAGNTISTVNVGGGRLEYELIMPRAMPIDDLLASGPVMD